MTDPLLPDWASIRRRYEETQDPVAVICAEAGIGAHELANRRKREAWRRAHPRPFPPVRKPRCEPSPAVIPPPERQSPAPRSRLSRARPIHAVEPVVASAPAPSSEVTGDPALGGEPTPSTPSTPVAGPSARSLPRRVLATPAARRRLLDRLVAAISMKLEQLERRMTDDLAAIEAGDATATDHERETRAIGALIDNLGKITEIEADLQRPADAKRGAAIPATDLADEAERCRRELADRLSRLVEAAAREA